MDALAAKSRESGETFDAEQQTEFDAAATEVGVIDKHITRLRTLEAFQAENAKAVTIDAETGRTTETTVVAKAGDERPGHQRVIAVERKLDKGIGFARF